MFRNQNILRMFLDNGRFGATLPSLNQSNASVDAIMSRTHSTHTAVSALLLLACVIVLSGCAANRYEGPINTFRDKTQQTIGVLSDFYSSRNSYEIDLYLQGIAVDSSLPVETVDANGQPTPLGRPVFSPASIKARLDALNLIGIYASRLYDLANTKAPTSFQTAATSLGQNLTSLDKTFQKLQGASDPTANKYVGPISAIIGALGQMYLEHKRDELIKTAVNDGAKPVNDILSQLRDDMDNVFSAEVITGANEKLAMLIQAYNRDRGKLTFEQRQVRLSQIKAAAAEAAASVGSAPAGLVTSMMNANNALVAAVQSPTGDKPANLAALNSALEAWTSQIQSLAGQVKLLIH